MALIRDVHERFGSTVLIVTHDMTVAATCQRTITIRDGRIVEDVRRTPSVARAEAIQGR